ncbi:hypothetical protein [Draconibacterium halophilum]|nr:hypothetical protein [Draconibacterium halophilum]
MRKDLQKAARIAKAEDAEVKGESAVNIQKGVKRIFKQITTTWH